MAFYLMMTNKLKLELQVVLILQQATTVLSIYLDCKEI